MFLEHVRKKLCFNRSNHRNDLRWCSNNNKTKAKFVQKMATENFFYLNILGELKSVNFPLGPDGSGLFCRYDVIAGGDWELVSGVRSGITQCANGGTRTDEIVFNMPIECTFKSTNIFGCELKVYRLSFKVIRFNVFRIQGHR